MQNNKDLDKTQRKETKMGTLFDFNGDLNK